MIQHKRFGVRQTKVAHAASEPGQPSSWGHSIVARPPGAQPRLADVSYLCGIHMKRSMHEAIVAALGVP
ncbi:MAG: hypothetical protein H0W16_05925, partial [Actinobacteria bacterium]|nr:hypothetical protein [Actinomycetota bacterium]